MGNISVPEIGLSSCPSMVAIGVRSIWRFFALYVGILRVFFIFFTQTYKKAWVGDCLDMLKKKARMCPHFDSGAMVQEKPYICLQMKSCFISYQLASFLGKQHRNLKVLALT